MTDSRCSRSKARQGYRITARSLVLVLWPRLRPLERWKTTWYILWVVWKKSMGQDCYKKTISKQTWRKDNNRSTKIIHATLWTREMMSSSSKTVSRRRRTRICTVHTHRICKRLQSKPIMKKVRCKVSLKSRNFHHHQKIISIRPRKWKKNLRPSWEIEMEVKLRTKTRITNNRTIR